MPPPIGACSNRWSAYKTCNKVACSLQQDLNEIYLIAVKLAKTFRVLGATGLTSGGTEVQ